MGEGNLRFAFTPPLAMPADAHLLFLLVYRDLPKRVKAVKAKNKNSCSVMRAGMRARGWNMRSRVCTPRESRVMGRGQNEVGGSLARL